MTAEQFLIMTEHNNTDLIHFYKSRISAYWNMIDKLEKEKIARTGSTKNTHILNEDGEKVWRPKQPANQMVILIESYLSRIADCEEKLKILDREVDET